MKGIIADLSLTILTISINIISIPIYISNIGLEQYGLWLTLSAVITAVNVFDVSVDQHIMKEAADDNIFKQKNWKHYLNYIIFYKLISCLSISFFSFLAFRAILHAPFITEENEKSIQIIIILCVLTSIIGIIIGYMSSVLYARGEFAIVSTINGIINASAIVISVFLIVKTKSITSIALGNLYAYAIGLLVYIFLYVKKIYYYQPQHEPKIKSEISLKQVTVYILKHHLLKIIFLLRTSGFIILLGFLTSLQFVGLYNIVSKVPQLLTSLLAKINTPYAPIFARMISNDQKQRLHKLVLKLASIQAFISIVVFIGLAMFLRAFVNLWAGVELNDPYLCLLISAHFAIQIFFAPNYQVAYANGEYGRLGIIFFGELIVFLVFVYSMQLIFHQNTAIFALWVSSLTTQIYISVQAARYLGIQFLSYIGAILQNIIKVIVPPCCMIILFVISDIPILIQSSWFNFIFFMIFYILMCSFPVLLLLLYKNGIASLRESFRLD